MLVMERSEPSLVPEWLRSPGSVTGGGSSAHHFASSSHSDISSLVHHTRNRNSKSISDFDGPRPAFVERTSSSNSRRSSSNGSAKHAYSSFNRSHRDKDRERDKERPSYGDHWDLDSSDPLGSILSSRVEKDKLRRSHSMVSRKQSEILPRRVAVDSKNSNCSNYTNGNGSLAGGSVGSSSRKSVFDKDFPSLGSEERHGVPDIGRVPSPGLSSAVQSLPVGNSALIGGERWTSALAEVPSVIGSNSSSSSSTLQNGAANNLSGPPSVMAGLNMAEALTQAPSRTRTAPQLSVKTQRLEELAIKQSRQLIPVTPSMPKGSALNFSDKSKTKAAGRTGEMNVVAKGSQQQLSPLHHANQSIHSGNVKSDMPKTSHGKLLVLKPARENGVSSITKDIASPLSNANVRVANNQVAAAPSAAPASRTPSNPKVSSGDRKAALTMITGLTVERKPSLSQTQSRHDFFNLLKKKTSTNTSSVPPTDSTLDTSSPTIDKSGEGTKEVDSIPASSHPTENGVGMIVNGGDHDEVQRSFDEGERQTRRCITVLPDEEEAAFLRSLGWDENYGDDEGLTEEEINSFYQEYKKRGWQPQLAGFQPSASSELASSESESEV